MNVQQTEKDEPMVCAGCNRGVSKELGARFKTLSLLESIMHSVEVLHTTINDILILTKQLHKQQYVLPTCILVVPETTKSSDLNWTT